MFLIIIDYVLFFLYKNVIFILNSILFYLLHLVKIKIKFNIQEIYLLKSQQFLNYLLTLYKYLLKNSDTYFYFCTRSILFLQILWLDGLVRNPRIGLGTKRNSLGEGKKKNDLSKPKCPQSDRTDTKSSGLTRLTSLHISTV